MRKSKQRTSYNPLQSGYAQSGKRYFQRDYSRDCRLGGVLSQLFEIDEFSDQTVRVVPDGCNDIIVLFDGREIKSWLSPSVSRACTFRYRDFVWLFGARFLPGATYSLFHDRVHYDIESAIDAKLILEGFEQVETALREAYSFTRRCEIMETYLLKHLPMDSHRKSEIARGVEWILDANGLNPVQELSEVLGYSSRYIRKLFIDHTGHSPKELATIIRMQDTLRFIEECEPGHPLSDAAARFGFSDQSHMNREFKKFLGITTGSIRNVDDWAATLATKADRLLL